MPRSMPFPSWCCINGTWPSVDLTDRSLSSIMPVVIVVPRLSENGVWPVFSEIRMCMFGEEPRPRVACPVCQKVRDVSTVSKHIWFGCNTLNGDGGHPSVQWKAECHKMLTPRVVDEYKVRGCPYQRTEKRREERVTKKKALDLLNTNPVKVEK